MSFQGSDPYGTPGGVDLYNKPTDPPDIRMAQTRHFVVFLCVNGVPIDELRAAAEDVVRVLGLSGESLVSLLLREQGTVIDANTSDLDFLEVIHFEEISPGVVQATVIDGSIVTTMLQDLSVTLAKLAAGSVDNSKLVDGTIQEAKLANDSISNRTIQAGAVDTLELALGAVTNSEVDALANIDVSKLNASQIAETIRDTIAAALVAGQSITITPNDPADTITFSIANGAIGLAQLAAGAVDSSKIADGSIVNADINATAAILFSKLEAIPGLVALGERTFSGTITDAFDNIFSTTYRNYLVVANVDSVATANNGLFFRWGVTGVGDDSGALATVNIQQPSMVSNFSSSGAQVNTSIIAVPAIAGGTISDTLIVGFLGNPFDSARRSSFMGMSFSFRSGVDWLFSLVGAQYQSAKSQNRFSILSGANIAGNWRIYGIRNS